MAKVVYSYFTAPTQPSTCLKKKILKEVIYQQQKQLVDAENNFQASANVAKYEYENKLIDILSVNKNYS